MKKIFGFIRDLAFALTIMVLAPLAHAQTVTLSVSPSSGVGSVTPTATWSTSPAASSCSASGGWTGAKAASGTQVLAAITANTTYSLTCTWGTLGTATVNWTAPTTNVDGTPLTDLAGFRIAYGTSPSNLSQSRTVNDPAARTGTITGLTSATWHFAVYAFNTAGRESDISNVDTKQVSATTRTSNAAVTVTPPPTTPNPPTNVSVTIASQVFDIRSGSTYAMRHIGNVPAGLPCGADVTVANMSGKWCRLTLTAAQKRQYLFKSTTEQMIARRQ